MKRIFSLIIPLSLILVFLSLKWKMWNTPNRQFYIFENGDCITVWKNARYKCDGKTYNIIVIPGIYNKHREPHNDNFFVTNWESNLIIAMYYTKLTNYKDTIYIEKESYRWGQNIKIINNSPFKASIKVLPDSMYKYYWGKRIDTVLNVKTKINVVELDLHDNCAWKRNEGHHTKPVRVP